MIAKQAADRAAPLPNKIEAKARAVSLIKTSEKARTDLAKVNGAAAPPKLNRTALVRLVPPSTNVLQIIPTEFSNRRNAQTPNLANTITALQTLGEFRWNRFTGKYLIGGHEMANQVGESIDNACSILRTAIIAQSAFEPAAATVEHAVRRLCVQNAFDPVRNYLDGLRHDGTARLDAWLTTYLGAEENPLNRAIGRKVLIAAVRRVRQPGVKFDAILVLEGPQGSGKSSAIRVLAGEYFSDAEILATTGKEQQELVRGVWLFEISELAGLQKSAIERVKAFVSRTHDRARGAWERNVTDQPRRCIFIGTTNDDKYLQDPTGNRRFWPVLTGKIDLAALTRDRDQLWAEAAAAETRETELTIDRDLWAAATVQQSARLVDDPWEDTLSRVPDMVKLSSGSIVVHDGELRVFTSYLLETILHIDPAHAKTFDGKRLGTCMRKLGWSGPTLLRVGNKVGRGYSRRVEGMGDGEKT